MATAVDLMGRAVLAEADRVMRHDVQHLQATGSVKSSGLAQTAAVAGGTANQRQVRAPRRIVSEEGAPTHPRPRRPAGPQTGRSDSVWSGCACASAGFWRRTWNLERAEIRTAPSA